MNPYNNSRLTTRAPKRDSVTSLQS